MEAVRRERIADAELLEWLMDGTLSVNIQNAQVTFRGRILKPTFVGRDDRNGTRYRIEIRHSGRKRSIVRARLVYMAGNLQTIPNGYEIHHQDEDRYNDAFANLVLLTEEDHKKIHGTFSYEKRSNRALTEVPF